MYTQCPECQIAFRVTATVLQQASGRVRCGGCGHAFSALEHLSEELPEQSSVGPELAAESVSSESDDDSSAQSKALLETIDELAGPDDVRIEDTGVEWRVLDEDEEDPKTVPEVTEQMGDDLGGSQHYLALKESPAKSEERRYDDNTQLPDEFEDIDDIPYTPPVDRPRRRAADLVRPVPDELLDMQSDLALSKPEEWTDILDEVGVARALEPDPGEAEVIAEDQPAEVVAEEDDDFGDDQDSTELSLDTIVELTDDLDELDRELDPAEEEDEEDTMLSLKETTGAFEKQIDAAQSALDRGEVEEWKEEIADDADDEDTISAAIEDDDVAGEIYVQADDAKEDPDAYLAVIEDEDNAGEIYVQVDESGDDKPYRPAPLEAQEQPEVATSDDEHEVPRQTDEEVSINEEIDQELMLASTTDDLVAETTVGKEFDFDENSPNVETIVMQGDFAGSAVDAEQVEKDQEALRNLQSPEQLIDTYMLNKGKKAAGRRKTDPPGNGIYFGILLLGIALATQIIHSSRESLATYGVFNQTIGPVYRALGRPVTPEWDIKGWQFEATNGSTDDDDAILTIVSRIVNQSEQPLPYPLVHVSLTDRWEETIGSRVLEPNEYLTGGLDPSMPVSPNKNFTALITMDTPSDEAAGFKLNVCYRVAPGRVRCAIEDFKN
jgi:predicted Zn finger-like uncharacterized protein